jgi:hypothetical protein
VYTTLVGKSAGKKPTGIHRYRWKNNTKMDVQETGLKGADWSHLAPGRGQVTGARKHGNEFLDSAKYGVFFTRSGSISLSRTLLRVVTIP